MKKEKTGRHKPKENEQKLTDKNIPKRKKN